MANERTAVVVCREEGCDWHIKVAFAAIPDYHGKACPKCQRGELINDKDMIIHSVISDLLAMAKQ